MNDKLTRLGYDYDKIKHQLKNKLQERHKFQGITTNYDFQNKMEGHRDVNHAKLARKNIQLKQQLGSIVKVKVNCFLDNTAYKDKYDHFDNVIKAVPIKPQSGPIGGHKFRGLSYYNQEMGN